MLSDKEPIDGGSRIRKLSEILGPCSALHHVDQQIRGGADKSKGRQSCDSPQNN